MKSENGKNVLQRRPAEIATPPAMAVAVLLCMALGIDDASVVGYVAVVVAFVPAVVTFCVELTRK